MSEQLLVYSFSHFHGCGKLGQRDYIVGFRKMVSNSQDCSVIFGDREISDQKLCIAMVNKE